MSISLNRRLGIVGLLALGSILLAVPIVLNAANNTAAVLEACVNPGNGNLRLVEAGTACHKTETRVEWNTEGPPGPPGPPGPSSGGPPFVYICTPAHLANGGGGNRSDLYVFNGGASTANIAVNLLDRDGNNLTGHTIPGTIPAETYPGEAGATTVPLSAAHTRNLNWRMPTTGPPPTFDGITDVVFTIRVTSDQPIVAGVNLQLAGFMPNECNLLPK